MVCERMLAEKDRADKLDKKVTELQPKADFFDAFVNPMTAPISEPRRRSLGFPSVRFADSFRTPDSCIAARLVICALQ